MKKDARQEIYLPRSMVFDELSVGLERVEDGEGSFFSITPMYGRATFVYQLLKATPHTVKMPSVRN